MRIAKSAIGLVFDRAQWPVAMRGFDVFGGAKGSRTPDLLNAIQALYQLSYGPTGGLSRALRRCRGGSYRGRREGAQAEKFDFFTSRAKKKKRDRMAPLLLCFQA